MTEHIHPPWRRIPLDPMTGGGIDERPTEHETAFRRAGRLFFLSYGTLVVLSAWLVGATIGICRVVSQVPMRLVRVISGPGRTPARVGGVAAIAALIVTLGERAVERVLIGFFQRIGGDAVPAVADAANAAAAGIILFLTLPVTTAQPSATATATLFVTPTPVKISQLLLSERPRASRIRIRFVSRDVRAADRLIANVVVVVDRPLPNRYAFGFVAQGAKDSAVYPAFWPERTLGINELAYSADLVLEGASDSYSVFAYLYAPDGRRAVQEYLDARAVDDQWSRGLELPGLNDALPIGSRSVTWQALLAMERRGIGESILD